MKTMSCNEKVLRGNAMNPHAMRSIAPTAILKSLIANRNLICLLVKRDVIGRYRGSVMGILWSFFNPLLMLAVYTFVFGVVFQASWTGGSESKTEFASVLFAGMLVFGLFSEALNRAPGLILTNVNYVKKVVFPLEILPVVALGSAVFHFLVGLLVWLIFHVLCFGIPSPTIVQLPLLIIPLILMTLGFSWLLASLGVYLRDVGQMIGVVTMILMFMSPIFYPVKQLPEVFRPFMYISPLTYVVEQARDTMIWGNNIHVGAWCVYMGISLLVAWLGFVWFQKTSKGFADVL
jgi:lipopolysaccharide transport system permease protein